MIIEAQLLIIIIILIIAVVYFVKRAKHSKNDKCVDNCSQCDLLKHCSDKRDKK